MNIHTVRVASNEDHDPHGEALLHDVRRTLGIKSITSIRLARVYRLEGLDEAGARKLKDALFCETINQYASVDGQVVTQTGDDFPKLAEVGFKPGVMNPEAASIVKAGHDLGLTSLVAADSSTQYAFYGAPTDAEVALILEKLLVNKIVSRVVTEEPTTLLIGGTAGSIATIPIREMDDDALLKLSGNKLFLNLEEMRVVQGHFRGLDRDPKDAELEATAQTWSEHCNHKSFHATLVVNGERQPSLMDRLKKTAALYGTNVISSFHDNSGVIKFYDGYAICGKVETHNSPSALEPYGGAGTGTGGVDRDIGGTGKGAKTILSTDMFCLAPWSLSDAELPPGCLPPSYLLKHVVRGVKDYGNRRGIPTANGSFHFHPDFRAKPSVIVGAYGIIPERFAQKGVPRPGDLIVAVGGRTGRDGINGATFSSGQMTAQTCKVNSNAVQIGHAVEQKRSFDGLIVCRDEELIEAITDCGAGGFCSAIGEIASKIGARFYTERAPLKNPGLAPYEILISESQERMILAVAPHNVARVIEICREHNVEATVLGEFTDDQRFFVTYHDQTVCDLSMEFLHNGLPKREMVAEWERPEAVETSIREPQTQAEWLDAFRRVLAHPNICSKEPVARLFDHGVQGTNALPSFTGVEQDGPNDAVVLRPLLDKPYGMVVSHGLNPILMRSDPYWGAAWAIAEAVSNYVAVGGDITRAGLIDNFIWPFPNPHWMGALKMAVDACCDGMHAFKVPFVSGKDSLSSTYVGGGITIHIPPVLCISAFGPIDDVARTVSADFKWHHSMIVLLGAADVDKLGGSIYAETCGTSGTDIPHVDLPMLAKIAKLLHEQISQDSILSCHDVSEGGIAVALTEMCIGGSMGAVVSLDPLQAECPNHMLFNETSGRFLVEVRNHLFGHFMAMCREAGIPKLMLGMTSNNPWISVAQGEEMLFQLPLDDLKAAWSAPMKEVFR